MLVQCTVVRVQPANRGSAMVYKGNPKLSETRTADGEFTTAVIAQVDLDTGWEIFRVSTDTNIYVKLGSAASVVPRYLVFAGQTIDLVPEKAGQNVNVAAA